MANYNYNPTSSSDENVMIYNAGPSNYLPGGNDNHYHQPQQAKAVGFGAGYPGTQAPVQPYLAPAPVVGYQQQPVNTAGYQQPVYSNHGPTNLNKMEQQIYHGHNHGHRRSSSSSISSSDMLPVHVVDVDKVMHADTPTHIRHAFAKKVFTLLLLSLTWAFGIMLIFSLVDNMREWMQTNGGFLIICAFFGMLAISLVLICSPKISRKSPTNLILFFLYSTCSGIMLASIGVYTDVSDVLIPAILTTMVIVLACTAFAFQTKKDFTQAKYMVFGMVACLSLITFGFIALFIRIPAVQIAYGCIGVLIFSFLLVLDCQLILGGKRSNEFSIDDYTVAALVVHADVINIFLYVLRIFTFAE